MGAKANGPASWIIDEPDDSTGLLPEDKKTLIELSKPVGSICNSGDAKAFQSLINYVLLVLETGYQVLKENLRGVDKQLASHVSQSANLKNRADAR